MVKTCQNNNLIRTVASGIEILNRCDCKFIVFTQRNLKKGEPSYSFSFRRTVCLDKVGDVVFYSTVYDVALFPDGNPYFYEVVAIIKKNGNREQNNHDRRHGGWD